MVHSKDFYKLYQDTYLHYRKIYGDKVAVFLQKGSFWEFYGIYDETTQTHENSVKEFTDIMGIQVNYYAGDAPDGKTGLFAGVPEHVLDKWAGRLTSIGWTVVVITQEKNSAGAVIDRKVTRILSPGTHVENVDAATSCIVASIYQSAVVAIDTTTGSITFYSGDQEHVKHFLQVHPPKECIADVAIDTTALYCPSSTIFYKKDYLKTLERLGASAIARELYLQDVFKPKTIVPFPQWLCMDQPSQIALSAALLWLQEHYPNLIVCLPRPLQWHPSKNMRIINNALQQINIIGPQQLTIAKLFLQPYTAPGKRALPQLLCTPYATVEEITAVQEKVRYCIESPKKSTIENKLRLLSDIPRIHRLIVRGALRAGTALQLYQSYSVIRELCGIIGTGPSPWTTQISIIENAARVCMEAFDGVFDRTKALLAMNESADWGFLNATAAPKSASTEAEIQNIYGESIAWLEGLNRCAGLPADMITYKPTEKNVFALHAVKSTLEKIDASAALKKNPTYSAIKIKSLTTAGKIEHVALEKFNERLDHKRAVLERNHQYELNNACIHYSESTAAYWSVLESWMVNLDCTMAYANTTTRNGWTMPDIEAGDRSAVTIKKLRHPLIEAQQNTQVELVTHDIELRGKKGMLLYGVNSSGKSSLMKSLGIAVILAQLGCGVPAVEMRLTPYAKIATRIINHDNLWAGLSSFAVEMTELREILAAADEATLILGDELCSGTETDSASSLVAAGIDWLLKAGSSFILATHLHDLVKLPLSDSPALAIYHLRVHHDTVRDCLVYDRQLVPGSGPSTYGITVAKALHLPPDFIENAHAYRKILTGTVDANRATNPYNANVLKRKCEVCEKEITTDLEIHHINEQADSKNGRHNVDGTALNGLRNLVTLCKTCHDDHHAGKITVGPVQQTTAGPMRRITTNNAETIPSKKKKTILDSFSADEIARIAAIKEKNSKLDKKLIIHIIKEQLDIDITIAQLNAILRQTN